MSSFPKHTANILALKEIGFDVNDCFDEDGNVTMESWYYDDLVEVMSIIVDTLKQQSFEVFKE